MSYKTKRSVIIAVCFVIMALGISAIALMLQGQGRVPAGTGITGTMDSGIHYNGKWYPFRDDLQTVLFMGLDKYERPEDSWGYLNNQQSDFLILLVIDDAAKQYDILHLNRDTMTQINRLGVGGGEAGTFTGQLALAHTYGSGGSDSCLNAAKAVSTLLGGIRIDHYVTMTMGGVEIITDLVGGVSVEILDDFTAIDPQMVKGETVLLNGSQALAYVRTRMQLDDSSNLHRMERQRQFMRAMYEKVLACKDEDPNFVLNLLLELSDSVMSDCAANQLDSLSHIMESYTMNDITPLEGEAIKGEQYMEFYVDEESLKKTVVELFCQ